MTPDASQSPPLFFITPIHPHMDTQPQLGGRAQNSVWVRCKIIARLLNAPQQQNLCAGQTIQPKQPGTAVRTSTCSPVATPNARLNMTIVYNRQHDRTTYMAATAYSTPPAPQCAHTHLHTSARMLV